MSLEEVRNAIRERIADKKQMDGAGAVMTDINKVIQRYPELTPRERDFAFRSSVENRTVYQWAALYNCSYAAIYYMLHNPRVKELVEEIQFNVRKYAVGMQMLLIREAMMQYLKIFRTPENGDTIEAKRKAAKEVLGSAGLIKDTGEEGGSTQTLNVNLFGGRDEAMEQVSDGQSVNISVSDIEREFNELKELENIRSKVKEIDSKAKTREIHDNGGGFEGGKTRDIQVD